jgi:plasmid replication initiation protein
MKVPTQLIVTKSNNLAQASSNLTLVEAKVMEYCISTIFKGQVVTSEDIFEVDVNHLANLFGIDRSQAYREIRNILLSLRRKNLDIHYEGIEINTSWISAVYMNTFGDGLHIQLSPVVATHLSAALLNKGKFVAYPLVHIARFKHRFSIILYNLCKSNNYKGKEYRTDITVDELRKLFCLEENEFRLWADLKKVLQGCIKEIEAGTKMKIVLYERKTGKKVTRLGFVIKNEITIGATA